MNLKNKQKMHLKNLCNFWMNRNFLMEMGPVRKEEN